VKITENHKPTVNNIDLNAVSSRAIGKLVEAEPSQLCHSKDDPLLNKTVDSELRHGEGGDLVGRSWGVAFMTAFHCQALDGRLRCSYARAKSLVIIPRKGVN
jgi:hypothetical protein